MTNKEKSIAVYNQRFRQKDPKVIEETYSYFAPKFSLPPRLARDGVRYTMELVAQRATAGKQEPFLEKFVDDGLVEELEREGFFKNLAQRSPAK